MTNAIHNYEKYDASLPELSIQIASLKNLSFSGALTVRIGNEEWRFWLRIGKLGWVSGGDQAITLWKKHLLKYSPQFPLDRVATIADRDRSQLASNALAQALVDELIDRQQLTQLTIDLSREMRSEIASRSKQNGDRLYYKISPDSIHTQLNFILPLVDMETL